MPCVQRHDEAEPVIASFYKVERSEDLATALHTALNTTRSRAQGQNHTPQPTGAALSKERWGRGKQASSGLGM